jgi:hypothetical protein
LTDLALRLQGGDGFVQWLSHRTVVISEQQTMSWRKLQRRKLRRRKISRRPPQLSEDQILRWADAFHVRSGRWPRRDAGTIAGALGETWARVDNALKVGVRGLPGGSSLVRLLAQRRDLRNVRALPHLTDKLILAWADAHFRRTGKWPNQSSGPVSEAPAAAQADHQASPALG